MCIQVQGPLFLVHAQVLLKNYGTLVKKDIEGQSIVLKVILVSLIS